MFLAGCGASGLESQSAARDVDSPGWIVAPTCFSYGILRGKGSIRIEWTLTAVDSGDAFSVQRASAPRWEFEEFREIRTGAGELSFYWTDADCRPGTSYRYRVERRPADGAPRILFETEAYAALATPTALEQNYPNPFNAVTAVPFAVAERGRVSLLVYGVEGRLVRVLVDSPLDAGPYEAVWDGRDGAGRRAAAGIYFCRLEVGRETISRKMILVR